MSWPLLRLPTIKFKLLRNFEANISRVGAPVIEIGRFFFLGSRNSFDGRHQHLFMVDWRFLEISDLYKFGERGGVIFLLTLGLLKSARI